MPRLSVYFVRASLLYLAVGITFGALLLANKGLPFAPWVWALLPIHIEFLFMGWLAQLALGIAFWILPRFSRGSPRGDERWSWAAFIMLNGGIFLVAIPSLFAAQWLILVGRIRDTTGLLAFAWGNWKRVKPSGA